MVLNSDYLFQLLKTLPLPDGVCALEDLLPAQNIVCRGSRVFVIVAVPSALQTDDLEPFCRVVREALAQVPGVERVDISFTAERQHAAHSTSVQHGEAGLMKGMRRQFTDKLFGRKSGQGRDGHVAIRSEQQGSVLSDDQLQGIGIGEVKHVIAVASGKGGVGKSTFSANFAVGLSQLGLKVGLLDGDIYGPSQPHLFGVQRKPDVLDDGRTMIPISAHGVSLMSIGFLLDPDAALVWRGPMVISAIKQLLHEVAWGKLDALVVDMPPGTGDAHLTLAQHAALSGAVIVSTPQDLALIDAVRGINMFEKVDVPLLGLVENMSGFHCAQCGAVSDVFGMGGARDAARQRGIPFLGAIGLDMALRLSADQGVPLVASDCAHAVSLQYLDVAKQVVTQLSLL